MMNVKLNYYNMIEILKIIELCAERTINGWFICISTFVGYSMPEPFLYK